MTANHQYGRDYRVKIDDGTGAMIMIAGETSWSKKSSSDKIDFSTKDDGSYKAQGYGQRELTISVSGKVKLPDAGISRVQAVEGSSPPEVRMQIVKTAGSVVIFDGLVGIGNFSVEAPSNGAIPYSFDATAAAAPTVNSLDAVV